MPSRGYCRNMQYFSTPSLLQVSWGLSWARQLYSRLQLLIALLQIKRQHIRQESQTLSGRAMTMDDVLFSFQLASISRRTPKTVLLFLRIPTGGLTLNGSTTRVRSPTSAYIVLGGAY
jgi:hypothetical protein